MNIFLEETEKPKVLFLHGFGSNKKFISSIIKFDRNFSIVSIDLHNKTNNSLQDMVQMVKKIIIENNWNSLIIVGHSMGGFVATMLSDVKQVKKVILVSPLNPFYKPKENLINILLPANEKEVTQSLNMIVLDKNVFSKFLNNRFMIETLIKYTKTNFEQLVPLIKKEITNLKFLENNLVSLYKNYFRKIIIINGKNDSLISIDSVRFISTNWNIKLFEIENCGHLPLFEKPEESVAIINQFI